LKQGEPQSGTVINFNVERGISSLSAASVTTKSSGFASTTAHLTNHSADVQVSACVAPGNSPCQSFTLFATPPSLWKLETVSGAAQAIADEQAFQPLVLRVTDGSSAANSVMGVKVTFQTTLARVPRDTGFRQDGDTIVGGTAMPVILGITTTQVLSDVDGLAKMTPDDGDVSGPSELMINASAGNAAAEYELVSGTRSAPGVSAVAPRDERIQAAGRESREPRAASHE
jgi:hypothetical protein